VGCTPRTCTDPTDTSIVVTSAMDAAELSIAAAPAPSRLVCQNSLCVGPPSSAHRGLATTRTAPVTVNHRRWMRRQARLWPELPTRLDLRRQPLHSWGFCWEGALQRRAGDQYCGDIDDGCGGIVHCNSTCAKSGWLCDQGLCIGRPRCAQHRPAPPRAATVLRTIGDGCGGALACGACSDGSTCGETVSHVCGSPDGLITLPLPPPAAPRRFCATLPPPPVACPVPSPPPPAR